MEFCFLGKFGILCFLVTVTLRLAPFLLLTTRVLFHKCEFDDSVKTTCGNVETFGKINFEFCLIYFDK